MHTCESKADETSGQVGRPYTELPLIPQPEQMCHEMAGLDQAIKQQGRSDSMKWC